MVQKRSCSLSTKVDGHFRGMVKIGRMTMNNADIFTIYKSLLQNVIKMLPVIYKTKLCRKFWVQS